LSWKGVENTSFPNGRNTRHRILLRTPELDILQEFH
jgi:hypothetical protein